MKSHHFLALALALAAPPAFAADAPKPIRALLITGGCCHDYGAQKDLLKSGIEARANIVVDQMHSENTTGSPPLPLFGNPDYARGYDVVIHDECAADPRDPSSFKSILKPHLDGLPAVNLHCAMHSFRSGDYTKPVARGADNAQWYEYVGLQSTGHGPLEPIAITFVDKDHPITRTLDGWTTVNEELYNNVQILDGKALAKGRQIVKQSRRQPDGSVAEEAQAVETVVVWTNEFGPKKTRVFSTSLGHTTATVADARYLDLVTQGILWATGKVDQPGYAKKK
ncbi:ThuA domain-containing protein [Roseateles sp. P5_E1]